ncbi:hypothetical protein ACIQPR_48585 [Streptomyces sp. NPDC091280]|uniref:hypothetical protein n=1 Tax=Streptomyces sp. NPDC091280 TaxID=3365984 RepID=UPI003814629C
MSPPASTGEPVALLWFFMLQRYEAPAQWVDTADRYVELKPRNYPEEPDPVAEYCVRHMKARTRKGQPKYRVMVHEYSGRAFCQAFVVHIDGTRTSISV